MATSSMVVKGRGATVRVLGGVCAALAAAALLAFAFPAVQQHRATSVCSRAGGELRVETEAVEPLVSARTVYRCYGPGGRVLGSW